MVINKGENMTTYKLLKNQKLVKEMDDFLLVQCNKDDGTKWFEYLIHKNAVNNFGNYGYITFAEPNLKDASSFAVVTKNFHKKTYKKIKTALDFVRREWA